MVNIQPITLWIQGGNNIPNVFGMVIVNDDLSTRAQFYFRLGFKTTNEGADDTLSWLQDGNLTITGEDYQQWDADPSANEWAYNWAANQLNLVII